MRVSEAGRRPQFLSKHFVYLTLACNERCLFCSDGERLDGTIRPFEEIVKDLRKGRELGHERVGLSGGGEPTLHPDFVRIVDAAKKCGYGWVHVTTNGRRFSSKPLLERSVLSGLDGATFSIHGHTAELNDRVVDAPGSFVQSIAGLQHALGMPRLSVNVQMVLNRINEPHAAEMLRYFKGLGVPNVAFKQPLPVGWAWSNRGVLFPEGGKPQPALWQLFERSDDPELRGLARDYVALHVEQVVSTVRTGFNGLLGPFLDRGERPACWGEKCRVCPFEPLCLDLDELKRTGRLEASPSDPACAENPWAEPEIPARFEAGRGSFDDFVSYFVRHRWRFKGRACARCPHETGCRGATLDSILDRGFPTPPFESRVESPTSASCGAGLRRRRLAAEGPWLPEVGFDAAATREVDRAAESALASGILFFCGSIAARGSEESLGRVLKGRTDAFAATRIPPRTGLVRPADRLGFAYPEGWLEGCVERSLRLLRHSTIDLVLLQGWRDSWLDEPHWQELLKSAERLRAEGKIRLLGASLRTSSAGSGLRLAASGCVDVIESDFHHLDASAAEKLLPACRRAKVGFIARCSQPSATAVKFCLSFPEVSLVLPAAAGAGEIQTCADAADGRYFDRAKLESLRA